jgi:drug/metabolite transporter (DMT)-like permease
MFWLIIAISAYFLFALASLGDKYLLIGPPKPKVYAFYVGLLNITALLLIPFVGFYLPGFAQVGLSFLYGLIFILALLVLYYSLERFEVSRIIPALGAFLPIFTFLLAFFILGQEGFFTSQRFLSFSLLILGSIIISLEKSFKLSLKSIFFAGLAGFFLSLGFVLSKIVYSDLGFWPGFIWMRIGTFFFALFLILFKEVRKEIFKKKKSFTKKTGVIFILTQATGALAVILQSWSIALVDVIYISFISALQGLQYFFLFIFSLFFYKRLKEKITKKIIFQKISAIILIIIGLTLLALN